MTSKLHQHGVHSTIRIGDHLPPLPGRLHVNTNADHALGNELYVVISCGDTLMHVHVIAQNIACGSGAQLAHVSRCVLRDP